MYKFPPTIYIFVSFFFVNFYKITKKSSNITKKSVLKKIKDQLLMKVTKTRECYHYCKFIK